MKVILTEDVPKVGKRGEVVDVKSGYAHNFLFKNNVAVEATKGNLKKLAEQQKNLSCQILFPHSLQPFCLQHVAEQAGRRGKYRGRQLFQLVRTGAVKSNPDIRPGLMFVGCVNRDLFRHNEKGLSGGQGISAGITRKNALSREDAVN